MKRCELICEECYFKCKLEKSKTLWDFTSDTSKCEHVNLYLNIDVYIFILDNKKPRALNAKFYAYICLYISFYYCDIYKTDSEDNMYTQVSMEKVDHSGT